MSEVKRWYVDEWSDCREANDGPFVKYPDYTALAERLKACEGVEEQLVEIYMALDGLPFSEKVEGKPCAKHLSAVEQIKRLRTDLDRAQAEVTETQVEKQRTESELNQALLDKRRAEDDRDEWERHLHIERREHQKAIEERDRARARIDELEAELRFESGKLRNLY